MHIPHDSKIIPSSVRDDFLLNDEDLKKEIIAMTDSHTNELYDYHNAKKVIFPVSRLVLDPERFVNDEQEVMAKRGMGVLYEVTSELKPLRNKLNKDKRESLLNQYYYPHHKNLTRAVKDELQKNGKCLLIDCHSFPSRPLPYELASDSELRSQICIGTDSFHTPDYIRVALNKFFLGKGYSVSIDDPFAGALVPMDYYKKNSDVMAVMYEIRRDIYMDEKTGKKTSDFQSVKNDITESISLLDNLLTHSS